jgi:hypothetical protein
MYFDEKRARVLTIGIELAAINQNWLCGHNLYNALLQGYQIGGRITALGTFNHVIIGHH